MREKINQFFYQWGRLCARHPWTVIVATLMLTAALVADLPPRIDTTMEGFLRADSPAVKTYNQLREQFGRDEMMIATVTTDDIFKPAFIHRLQTLEHDVWQQVPC